MGCVAKLQESRRAADIDSSFQQMSSSSSAWSPDVWGWLSNLPPISEWRSSTTMSVCLCSRSSSTQPSLNVSITKSTTSPSAFLLSLVAQFRSLPISLWTSSPFPTGSATGTQQTMFRLFRDVVDGVLQYGPGGSNCGGTCSFRNLSVRYDEDDEDYYFGDVFNLAFMTLAFLVCVYEAPGDLLRTGCLDTLRIRVMGPRARRSSKVLTRALGASLEQDWMRSVNLAVTNCIVDLETSPDSFTVPNPMFSSAFSTGSLWKVQLFCPVAAMTAENTSGSTQDERLLFSLRYQHLQGVFQLSHTVLFHQSGMDVLVGVDNIRFALSLSLSPSLCNTTSSTSPCLVLNSGTGDSGRVHVRLFEVTEAPNSQRNRLIARLANDVQIKSLIENLYSSEMPISALYSTRKLIKCDVDPLLSEALMAERGLGSEEKHFPSRVSLHLTPVHQSDVLAVSTGKSSGNPASELELEKTIEGTLQPQNPYLGLTFAATETTRTTAKPWTFEQSVRGSTAKLSWFLHDVGARGREVHATRPSKFPLLHHGVGFRDRYESAYRPFTREGGVVFAGDEYGERVRWKLRRKAMGRKSLDWEMRGWVWLTYLPNKRWSHHSETRMVEFREVVQLPLPQR